MVYVTECGHPHWGAGEGGSLGRVIIGASLSVSSGRCGGCEHSRSGTPTYSSWHFTSTPRTGQATLGRIHLTVAEYRLSPTPGTFFVTTPMHTTKQCR